MDKEQNSDNHSNLSNWIDIPSSKDGGSSKPFSLPNNFDSAISHSSYEISDNNNQPSSSKNCPEETHSWTEPGSLKPQVKPKNRRWVRSRSWCAPRSEDGSITGADIRLLRERLLRTQAVPRAGAIRSFNYSQKVALLSLALVDFMSFCSMSIMAPFFPREANAKGMSEAVSGFVFSFYALVMFVTSPIFGKILPIVGAKFLFMSGMFLAGSCNLLFGVLEYINDYNQFTIFCFLIRGLEALGASAFSTASYVYVINTFPNNIGSVFGILETFVGLGMSVGPAIGGLLYSVGGFGLPFYVLGIAMVVSIPIICFLSPLQDEYRVTPKSGSIFALVKVPTVVITGLVIVVVSNTWAFLDPTLEPHLRQFGLNAEQIGLIFFLFSALYGIFSPIWGWISDRVEREWCMMVWGLILSTIGLLLIGPSPLLPFLTNSLWIILLGLSILGVSVALTLLPTFQGVLTSSIEEGGYSDTMSTYSIVAGVWSCMYSLGEVIGPSLGGVLLKNYGFPICSTVMAALTFVLAILTFVFFAIRETLKSPESSDSFSDNSQSGWTISNPIGSNGSYTKHTISRSASETSTEETQPLIENLSPSNPLKIYGTGSPSHDSKVAQYIENSSSYNDELMKSKNNNTEKFFSNNTKLAFSNVLMKGNKSEPNFTITLHSKESQKHENTETITHTSIENDSRSTLKKMKSELLLSLNKYKKNPQVTIKDILLYNDDKIKFYNDSRRTEVMDSVKDNNDLTEIKGTIKISLSGAFEV